MLNITWSHFLSPIRATKVNDITSSSSCPPALVRLRLGCVIPGLDSKMIGMNQASLAKTLLLSCSKPFVTLLKPMVKTDGNWGCLGGRCCYYFSLLRYRKEGDWFWSRFTGQSGTHNHLQDGLIVSKGSCTTSHRQREIEWASQCWCGMGSILRYIAIHPPKRP